MIEYTVHTRNTVNGVPASLTVLADSAENAAAAVRPIVADTVVITMVSHIEPN